MYINPLFLIALAIATVSLSFEETPDLQKLVQITPDHRHAIIKKYNDEQKEYFYKNLADNHTTKLDNSEIWSVALSPDGAHCAYTSKKSAQELFSNNLTIHAITTNKRETRDCHDSYGIVEPRVKFFDNNHLILNGMVGKIALIDLEHAEPKIIIEDTDRFDREVACFPTLSYLVYDEFQYEGAWPRYPRIFVWDIRENKKKFELNSEPHQRQDYIQSLWAHNEKPLLISGGGDTAYIWDLTKNSDDKCIAILNHRTTDEPAGNGIYLACLSPDAHYALTSLFQFSGYHSVIYLWDVITQTALSIFKPINNVPPDLISWSNSNNNNETIIIAHSFGEPQPNGNDNSNNYKVFKTTATKLLAGLKELEKQENRA